MNEENQTKDGLSIEKAIVIDITDENEGVAAEYDWLEQNYRGYKLLQQSLVFAQNKPYDLLRIQTSESNIKELYFDISKFFGVF